MSETINMPAITLTFSVGTFIVALICLYAIIQKPKRREIEQELQINESENNSFNLIFHDVKIWYVINILSWIFLIISIAKFMQRFM